MNICGCWWQSQIQTAFMKALWKHGMNLNQTLLSILENTTPTELVSCISHYLSSCLSADITEKWAMVFRHFEYKDTNTNMFVERWMCIMWHAFQTTSFHNKLKMSPRYLTTIWIGDVMIWLKFFWRLKLICFLEEKEGISYNNHWGIMENEGRQTLQSIEYWWFQGSIKV